MATIVRNRKSEGRVRATGLAPGAPVPLIVLGGHDNALSIARSLGSRGVPVHCLGTHPILRRCRYARVIDVDESAGRPEDAWAEYLLGPRSETLRGAVLLAASDAGLQLIAERRAELVDRFVLDLSDPAVQLCMLDKLSAYRAATAAGIPTPRYWLAGSVEEIEGARDELRYPLLVKPLLSHDYQAKFSGSKFVVAHDFDQARAAVERITGIGIDVMLVERIPGPDSLLCSYYTYLEEEGQPLFHFTKRIIRRHPAGMGLSCCEITDRIPDVQEVALRFFQAVGLRGLGNAEFKRDPRDGVLRLIECNARFTAANGLVRWAGFDLALLVYNRLTGGPLPPLATYRSGRSLWHPMRDWRAYKELSAAGEITFGAYVRSLARPQMLSYVSPKDPMPVLADLASIAQRGARAALRRARR